MRSLWCSRRAAMAVSVLCLAAPARAAGPAAAPKPAAPLPPLPPLAEARPPLPPEPEREPVPWQDHIEVGGGVAFIEMPVTRDGGGTPTPVRFAPSVGFHLDLSWQVFRYLRFTGYLVEHQPSLILPPGAFNLSGPLSTTPVDAYTFGVRVSPTLPIGERTRLWVTAGWGFRYMGFGRVTLPTEAGALNETPTVPTRTALFFEIPVGVGGSIVLVPRWLSLHFEMTGSFLPSQIGNAECQSGDPAGSCGTPFINYAGKQQLAGPVPHLDATFVQTLGLSIFL